MNEKELIKFAESLVLPLPEGMLPLDDYQEIHANFSSGKDSLGFVLLLIYGYKVPREKIRLVHMRVDGHISNRALFDWPQTDTYLDYCAEKLQLPLDVIFSHKGMEQRIRERGQWPAPGQQYCTSSLKRDVYAKWARQRGEGNYLCCSGERAQESPRRAGKPTFEIYKPAHSEKKKRHVHWWRPIHHLMIDQVWELIRLAGIKPHPCYEYVSRCSCRFCIFLTPLEMKRVSKLYPAEFQVIQEMEKSMQHTMKWEKGESLPIEQFIAKHDDAWEENQLNFDWLPCAL